jgi:hypothetical protein
LPIQPVDVPLSTAALLFQIRYPSNASLLRVEQRCFHARTRHRDRIRRVNVRYM